MRVAVGSMHHESNTFTSLRTRLADFRTAKGEEIFSQSQWKSSSAMGIIETLKNENIEVLPTHFGSALVSGMVEMEAYQKLKNGIVESIKNAGGLDGICLGLHGSMYVEGLDDPEGDLLSTLREMVGPKLPIVCALDMHTTLTDKMIKSVNGFTAYRTAPHVDVYETGVRAADMLLQALNGTKYLAIQRFSIPMLISGEQSETDTYPMKDMIALIKETEKDERFESVDFLLGFPWADTPHHSVSAIAVGDEKDLELLQETAKRLAATFWEKRHEFQFSTESYPIEEAIHKALEDPSQPIIISDTGDNPTAGATEDLTVVLKSLIEHRVKDVLVVIVVDAKSRLLCEQAGEGKRVELALGRQEYKPQGEPLAVSGTVLRLGQSQGIDCAVVDIEGITVIVTAERTAVYDPTFLEELNINPTDYKMIIVKSGYISPDYQKIASRKMFALTPGDTAIDLAQLPYRKAPRPIYPLDKEMELKL